MSSYYFGFRPPVGGSDLLQKISHLSNLTSQIF